MIKPIPLRRLGSTIFLAVCLSSCSANSMVDVVSPRDKTLSAIVETSYRVELYAQLHDALPQSLRVLPNRAGHANESFDAWHHPLHYHISHDKKIVTLMSFGMDGKRGGSADDADISVSYHALRDRNGVLKLAEICSDYLEKLRLCSRPPNTVNSGDTKSEFRGHTPN